MRASWCSPLTSLLLLLGGLPTAAAEEPAEKIMTVRAKIPTLPLIGDPAPDFTADTTEGQMRFPDDYRGSWVVLFSHPADFTPVCTSEFIVFASMMQDFEALGAKLVGLSVDSVEQHQAWKKSIASNIRFGKLPRTEIRFPIIGDHDGEIAWLYGMLHPHASETRTVRAVYVIDPKSIIRAMVYYPPEVGRDIGEIKRLVIALQTADKHRVATPANWRPGEDVLVRSDPSKKSSPKEKEGRSCQEWYFCTERLPQK